MQKDNLVETIQDLITENIKLKEENKKLLEKYKPNSRSLESSVHNFWSKIATETPEKYKYIHIATTRSLSSPSTSFNLEISYLDRLKVVLCINEDKTFLENIVSLYDFKEENLLVFSLVVDIINNLNLKKQH